MTFCLLFLSESIGILFQNDDKQLHEIEKDVISIQREIHESLIAEDKEMVSGLTCYISFIWDKHYYYNKSANEHFLALSSKIILF